MIEWFAKNDIAAHLLMVTIIGAGCFSSFRLLKVEVFPKIEPNIISIFVSLPNAAPEDVESGIAVRIEAAMEDLEGIETIISKSNEGYVIVTIEVDSDYEPMSILADIKNRVNSIRKFPTNAKKPVISLEKYLNQVISVVISGPYSEVEIYNYAEQVRSEILYMQEISQVKIVNVRKFEISIEASQYKLREYNVTLADIGIAVKNNSLDASVGTAIINGSDTLIRSKGQAHRQREFENIIVKTNPNGSIVRIGNLAKVNYTFKEGNIKFNFNGDFATLINIYRIGNQSAIQIANTVRRYIEEKQKNLPLGTSLSYWDDHSQYLKARLNTLLHNGIQGGILVMLLLALFLKPSVAFWVVMGIPISLLGALSFMSVLDISINMISAFGFIIVLGIIADDAIITGENVYSRMKDGMSGLNASIVGSKQIAIPVTYGMLTTVAAFLPLAFIEGKMGDFMLSIPMVAIPCLIFSLIESKLILPSHLKKIKINHGSSFFMSNWQKKFSNNFEQFILQSYKPMLSVCIHYRYIVLFSCISIFFLILTIIFSGRIHFNFLPKIESNHATVTLTMPMSTPFKVTDWYIKKITASAIQLKKKYHNNYPKSDEKQLIITDILSITGWSEKLGQDENVGCVRIETIPSNKGVTNIKLKDIAKDWRTMIGNIPNVESLIFHYEIIQTGDPIAIQLRGRSLKSLERIGDEVKTKLLTYTNIFNITDSISNGKDELIIELNRQGYILGLTRSDIIRQVSIAFRGFEAQHIQRGQDHVLVLIRIPKAERSSLSTLKKFLLLTSDSKQVPLSHVATITPTTSYSTITRINLERILTITADMDKEKINVSMLQKDLANLLDKSLIDFPNISYAFEGEAKNQEKAFDSLKVGLIILIFIIYCLLALPMKSYLQPIVIISVIPFGAIGAILGHLIMEHTLSFLSILGLTALTGIVINDSLVLLDHINQQLKNGSTIFDAALNAGSARFRAVMLTSLTTFIGLLPLMFEESLQAQFLIPMAISLGFGSLFAMFVTLIMIPTNILIAEDIKWTITKIFRFSIYEYLDKKI
ncbi:MAG: efflux RND transporter permease subunit [Piscirickettsiaceae bacterium]|nr:efflux RND transporter permease subunit [Piscirickettsiaceae bacterium]